MRLIRQPRGRGALRTARALVVIAPFCLQPSAHAHEPALHDVVALPQDAATAQQAVTPADPLQVRARSVQQVWNGVVAAPDGRLFAVFPRLANASGPFLAQVGDKDSLVPYPDPAWNGMSGAAARPSEHRPDPAPPQPPGPGAVFVGPNAIRLAPDGSLWVVDTGSPAMGRPAVPGGARLITIDLARNVVTQVLTLPADVLRPKSMIDNIRFNGEHAYITDAGAPGLIVLELATGNFRRVLDHDPSLTAQRPINVNGDILKGPDGKPSMIHADQLEVTPDGHYLFVQPLCGPMVRIRTTLLDDPTVSAATLSAAVEFWYDTPALGGTAIAPDGTLYLNDLETDSILALSPRRVLTMLIHDQRLHWADAPFLGQDDTLLVPVPQLDRAAPFHHGHTQTQFPVVIYALRPAELGAGIRSAASSTRAASAAVQPAAPAGPGATGPPP